jgi:nucleoid DNA-binding protein
MDISRHISDLLFEHECVIIPGFGGFVCSYNPANIHPVQHLFNPPSKALLFNPELKTNDGLLANQISVSLKITYNQALEIIGEFVNETLKSINSGSQITLETIGVIYADQEGNLQFKQNQKSNFLKESYGLTSFISPKINRNNRKITLKPEPQFTDRKAKTNSKTRRILANVAFIIVPVLLTFGYFYFNTGVFESGFQSKTSLLPDLTNEITSEKMAFPSFSNTGTDELPTDLKDDLTVINEKLLALENIPSQNIAAEPAIIEKKIEKAKVVPENKNSAVIEKSVVTTKKHVQSVSSTGVKYYLIGGSFENVENADKLISKYSGKGYNPQIIGQASNGYYRVSINDYLYKEDAMTELRRIRVSEIPGAWVLRQ